MEQLQIQKLLSKNLSKYYSTLRKYFHIVECLQKRILTSRSPIIQSYLLGIRPLKEMRICVLVFYDTDLQGSIKH